MATISALPLRTLASLLLLLTCYEAVTPASAVQMDESHVQVLLEVGQSLPFLAWTAPVLRNACDTLSSGINACDVDGFVTELYLEGTASGIAPPALSALTTLQSLTLAYVVNGTLPSTWSSLTQLEILEIAATVQSRVTGALPEAWSGMSRLKSLRVRFVDPVAKPVPLIGSAPPSWLGNLETLVINNAYWPKYSLPSSIGTSRTLVTFNIVGSVFKGTFPTGLLSNPVLYALEINVDQITSEFGSGSIMPSDLGAMTSLRSLRLVGCRHSGSLPTVYPPNLDSLYISYMTSLSGTIPPAIANHPTLTQIFLAGLFGLTGSLPTPSNPLTSNIYNYGVTDIPLTGTVPSSILGLKADIYLNNLDKLSGPFPTVDPSVAVNCRITKLVVSFSSLKNTPFPVSVLENCADLKEASFMMVGVIGQLHDFTAAPSLNKLLIYANPMGGTLPVIKFAQQASIAITYCQMTGVVDASYFNTTAFSSRIFTGNKLDLCSNNASIIDTGFVAASETVCDLSGQTPRECGCAEIWPDLCFTTRAMATDCATLPPDATTNPPIAAASSFVSSMALLVLILAAAASLL